MKKVTEDQAIVLYTPKLTSFQAVYTVLCLSVGIALPFLMGWQLLPLLGSLFLFVVAIWLGPVTTWSRIHHPILIINAEGINSQSQLIKWEEIDSVYRITARNGGVFAVDILPAGLVSFFARQGKRIPRSINITEPQLVLGISSIRLPIPVDELLALIRERFSVQIERYHIDCPVY